MHAVHDSASREERPEDRERERRDHEGEVPGAKQASLFFDHDRVQVGGRGEPRHDRRVLHRVPRPVAAPAKDGVAPPRAGDDTDAKKGPGDERETACRHGPAIAALAEDERRDGVCERHRREYVAEVEERRGGGPEGGGLYGWAWAGAPGPRAAEAGGREGAPRAVA